MLRCILAICILAGVFGLLKCKKAEPLDPVEEETESILGEYYPDGRLKFLKNISVPGSSKITPSADSTYYIVDLPSDYSKELVTVELTLYKGIKKADYTSSISKDTTIQYAFKGMDPLRIDLSGENGKKRMIYQVYFRVPGPINIQLLDHEIPIHSGGAVFPFKVISGLGTIDFPNEQNETSYLKIIDPKTGREIMKTYLSTLHSISLKDSVLIYDKVDLQLEFRNRETLKFNDIRFTRGVPNIQVIGYDYVKSRKDTINSYGGYFSQTSRYRAEYSNDFSPTISTDMHFVSYGNLTNQIPENIADGSYLVRFYENDKLMGESSVAISESNTNAIESIWQGDPYDIVNNRQFKKPVFLPGDVFYARPSTFVFEHNSMKDDVFQVKNLPVLKITNSTATVELIPEVQIISWAIAGIRYMVGKYTIPKNTKTGEYSATFIFPDKTESLPYWSNIQIR